MVQIFGAVTGAEIMRLSISKETTLSFGLGGCNTGNLTGNLIEIHL